MSGWPPFHDDAYTDCPSKSRKSVAFADGKLLKAGVLFAMDERNIKGAKMNVKKVFIGLDFRVPLCSFGKVIVSVIL